MKKTILFLFASFFIASAIYAQQDVRNSETIIADVLNRLPAQNKTDLDNVMATMEKLGENGFYSLAMKLGPYGQSNESREQFAIMGYTTYVSASGRENLKSVAESALIRAMNDNADINNKTFFMDMLQIIGTDKSVPAVSAFLTNKDLAYKASDVLAGIGTPSSGEALLNVLRPNFKDAVNITAAIEGLGYMKYKPAFNFLGTLATGNDPILKEHALKAIAQIGQPEAISLLLNATKQDNKLFGNVANTSIYSDFIENLVNNGFKSDAVKLADQFYGQSLKSPSLVKIIALQTLSKVKGTGAMKILSTAAFSNDKDYSGAALQLAGPFVNASNISLFTKSKQLSKMSSSVLPGLIAFLGNHKGVGALSTISNLAVTSKQADVKNAAIVSLARLGGKNAIPALLKIMNTADASSMDALYQALNLYPSSELSAPLLSQLTGANDVKKAAILNLLGDKNIGQSFSMVTGLLNSKNDLVRKAAFSALPNVSNEKSLPQLFNILNKVESNQEISSIQNAIGNVLSQTKTPENIVLSQLKATSKGKEALLFPLLSRFGDAEALKKVYELYQSEPATVSTEALQAIARWNNPTALTTISSVVNDPMVDKKDRIAALSNYISLISKDNVPDAQKLLFYEKAMSEAFTLQQKSQILNQVQGITSFPALAFAARYLDDANLANTASNSVINIGMSSNQFYGAQVREWLTRAADILAGHDDVYTKKAVQKFLDDMPQKEGYVSMFNGKNLEGWKGLVENPIVRAKMTKEQLAKAQVKADSLMRQDWKVENGDLVFVGKGYDNITSVKKYGNFEMLVDWKIFNDGQKDGDAGIYLRGTPQVQIWDTSRVADGAQVGSGGLYNNQKHRSTPLKVADNPLGDWNHFYIRMIGDKVTVYLNGELVTDNIPLENYWDRNMPLFPEEQIELQAHGSKIGYRNIYVNELPDEGANQLTTEEKNEGFKSIFNGNNLDGWTGNKIDYVVEDGMIVVRPQHGSHGNLYSDKEYGNFNYRFDFKLTPGANNGIGIRTPLEGDAAYAGMEIQVLDNTAPIYKDLQTYQYHGSVYGVIPAKRGFLNPVGEWNHEEISANGDSIKVILNGHVILDGDLRKAAPGGKTMDGNAHPGLFNKTGHIGFLGHGDVVFFKNIRIKEL